DHAARHADPDRRRPHPGASRIARAAPAHPRPDGGRRGGGRRPGGRACRRRGDRPGDPRRHDAADDRPAGRRRAAPARARGADAHPLDARRRPVLLRGPARRRLGLRAQVGGRPRPRGSVPGDDARRAVRPRRGRGGPHPGLPGARPQGRASRRGSAHPAGGGGAEADRRGLDQRADRRGARDLHQDGRTPPREHDGQARHARSRAAHPLCDPPGARGAL
ncbi:MAG: Two-component transcriptional response regulator, LuxR family, partial [uncultured Solirubrobacteraceae bacterium]